MTVFEMVFNLLGLVLGLSLVEVLSGLARTLKSRPLREMSWLTGRQLIGSSLIRQSAPGP